MDHIHGDYFAPPYMQYRRSNFDQMMNRNWIPQCVVESYKSNDGEPSCDELSTALPADLSKQLVPLSPTDPQALAIFPHVIGAPEKGGMCSGKATVYKVKDGESIQMSRGFNAAGNHPFSHWWNFGPPPTGESPDDYKRKDEMCADVNHMNTCNLKAGQLIAVGPGESMKCDNTIYPRARDNPLQVYVPNGSNESSFICQVPHNITPFPK